MPLAISHHIQRFEEHFYNANQIKWLQQHWYISIYVSVFYLMCVFLGRSYMKSRKPFGLRTPMFVWNAILSAFSFVISYRYALKLLELLVNSGFHATVCQEINEITFKFWGFWYAFSKALELIDTFFIVAGKRKLIFLHWYHHCTTLIFSWFLHSEQASISLWFIAMNAPVHTIMYAYFALRAVDVKIPRKVAEFITTCQIAQMIIGIFVTMWSLVVLLTGGSCSLSLTSSVFALAMYGPHFYMFCKLFYDNYISKEGKNKSTKVD